MGSQRVGRDWATFTSPPLQLGVAVWQSLGRWDVRESHVQLSVHLRDEDVSRNFFLPSRWEIAGTIAANLYQDLEATYWKDGKADPLARVTEWVDQVNLTIQCKLPI